MKLIDKMRAKAVAAKAKMDELLSKATDENRDMTAEESAEFDAAEAEVSRTVKAIERIAASEKSIGAIPAEEVQQTPALIKQVTLPGLRATVTTPTLTTKERIGIAAWGAARAKAYPTKSALQHLEDAGFQALADESRATTAKILERTKAFGSASGAGGDNVIDTPLSTDFIETLRNEAVFMRGQPVEVPMEFGSLKIPGGLAGASGTYTAEGSDIGYQQMTTRQISMSEKLLSAITAMNNRNIEISPLAVAAIVGDDLSMGLMLAMDSAGLRGDGMGNNPSGILTLAAAAHKITAAVATAPTLAQIDTEAKRMLTLIRGSNIPNRRRRWQMSNRVFTYLQFVRDGNGNLAFPGISAASPTWYDNYPVDISEQIPSNLGVGTNESELYLIDYGHVLVGVSQSLRIASSTEASYKDSGGTLVSAFSRDQTVIRGTAAHDFDMRHDKAAVILRCQWGA